MKVAGFVLAALLALALVADAGHELTFYPSFYPQEIMVRFVAAGAAEAAVRNNSLRA